MKVNLKCVYMMSCSVNVKAFTILSNKTLKWTFNNCGDI